jgi:prefoldin subunit 5
LHDICEDEEDLAWEEPVASVITVDAYSKCDTSSTQADPQGKNEFVNSSVNSSVYEDENKLAIFEEVVDENRRLKAKIQLLENEVEYLKQKLDSLNTASLKIDTTQKATQLDSDLAINSCELAPVGVGHFITAQIVPSGSASSMSSMINISVPHSEEEEIKSINTPSIKTSDLIEKSTDSKPEQIHEDKTRKINILSSGSKKLKSDDEDEEEEWEDSWS